MPVHRRSKWHPALLGRQDQFISIYNKVLENHGSLARILKT